jgi:hypothetical protein
LAWWAVRRVTEYSGRVNLWLAGGFGAIYAAYTVAQAWWPSWLGQQVFQMFNQAGGIAAVATGLVILGAVPAAFQYGLWDSNVHDRCRRLELLLLTRLHARDYWEAASAAAWRRGRGYIAIAALLWGAGVVSGQLSVAAMAGALAAGAVLWGLYFAVGFRAFSKGLHANGLGLALTLGLPLAAFLWHHLSGGAWAGLLPPGSVYVAGGGATDFEWGVGPVLGGVLALALARRARLRCDAELRRWYDLNHGRKALDG